MAENEISSEKIETILISALKLPAVRVDRKTFLKDIFISKIDNQEQFNILMEQGPIAAKIEKHELSKIATNLINKRTIQSTGISFATGVPGGIAMAATIPGDVMQFFGTTLRMAQELAYLYGSEEVWDEDSVVDEKVMNQMIIYLGVMFGVVSSNVAVKLLAENLAKQVLKRLPQQALMKTVWYRIIKKISKAIGVQMNKSILAKGVSKAIPVIGGVISGGMTYASMKPMGKRLKETLEEVQFNYDTEIQDEDLETMSVIEDIITVDIIEAEEEKEDRVEKEGTKQSCTVSNKNVESNIVQSLRNYKNLLDENIITQDEFEVLKTKLLHKAY